LHELASVSLRVAEIQWPLFGLEFEFLKAHFRPAAVIDVHNDRVTGYASTGHSRSGIIGNESGQEDFDFSPTSHCEFALRGSGLTPFRPHRHCNRPGAGAISCGRDAWRRKMSCKPLPSTRRAKRGRIELPVVYRRKAERASVFTPSDIEEV
jgi:hypothetical protein